MTPAQFWVDFANKTLGGGVFGNGFLQEEIMFLETPELANAAAQTHALTTRGGSAKPFQGSPTPLIFMGAHRVMEIDRKKLADGDQWKSDSVADLIKGDTPLPATIAGTMIEPETINVLSMAAPRLASATPALQTELDVVKDLFNTFDAGFTLAVDVSQAEFPGKPILIDTGPIGAGDKGFKNNKAVVNVMQQLAAIVVSQQTGTQVNLEFWAYNDKPTRNKDVNAAVKGIIEKFNGGGTNTISELLRIAQRIAENVAKNNPN